MQLNKVLVRPEGWEGYSHLIDLLSDLKGFAWVLVSACPASPPLHHTNGAWRGDAGGPGQFGHLLAAHQEC